MADEHVPAPAGWYGDPFGHSETRFWDGGHWTDRVRSRGVEKTDTVHLPPVLTPFTYRRIINLRLAILNLVAATGVVVGLDVTAAWAVSWNCTLGIIGAGIWPIGREVDSRRRWQQVIGAVLPDPEPHQPIPQDTAKSETTIRPRSSLVDETLTYLGLRQGPSARLEVRTARPYVAGFTLLAGVMLIWFGIEGLGIFLAAIGSFSIFTIQIRRHLIDRIIGAADIS